jgi:uncharacterized membrane protein YgcG
MGNNLSRLYVFVALLVLIVGVTAFYYIVQKSLPPESITIPQDTSPNLFNQGGIETRDTLPPVSVFRVIIVNKNTVRVTWENLSSEVVRLDIFRSITGDNRWRKWKSIKIPVGQWSGSVDIILGSNEDAENYSYYAQSFTNIGITTWSSEVILATLPIPEVETIAQNINPSSSGDNGSSGSGSGSGLGSGFSDNGSSGDTSPPSQSNPPGTSTTTQITLPPPSTSTPPPTPTYLNIIYYYSPNGNLIGTSTPIVANFWVQHINKNIEVGWQNLPPQTELIRVYRSKNTSGPWEFLLEQTQIDYVGPSSLKIIDSTLNTPYYYRIEARVGSEILADFGAVYLEPLQ